MRSTLRSRDLRAASRFFARLREPGGARVSAGRAAGGARAEASCRAAARAGPVRGRELVQIFVRKRGRRRRSQAGTRRR